MTDHVEHIHSRLLQEYADGVLPHGEKNRVLTHLGECETCRAEVTSMTRLDSALKRLPRERAGEWMTRAVMNRLDVGRGSDLTYRMISHVGGPVALLFVAGIVVTVYSVMGVTDMPGVFSGENGTGVWLEAITDFISRAAGTTGSLAGRIMPTAINTVGGLVWVFGAAVLGILGGIDLLVQRRSARH